MKRCAECILCAFLTLSVQGCFLSSRKPDDQSGMLALLALAGGAASLNAVCSSYTGSAPSGTALADVVTSAPANTGSGFTDSRCATNGVRGGGDNQGSTDVFSLSATGTGAVMVLSFNNQKITNGTGTDFLVFENPFNYNGSASTRFMEPMVVEVSYDGLSWCGFNPSYSSGTYSTNPANWTRFAGTNNVLYNQETNSLSSASLFSSGGGDSFDLANLVTGTSAGANCLSVGSNSGCAAGNVTTLQGTGASQGVRYIRLIAASACTNPNAGSAVFPQDSGAFGGGPDVDGIIGRYPASLP